MIGKLLGAWVGSRIDQRDGEGGLKGALIGTAAVSIVRRLGPLGLVLGGAYIAKRALDPRRVS